MSAAIFVVEAKISRCPLRIFRVPCLIASYALDFLSVAVGVINHILSWTPISCFIRSKLVLRHANTIEHDVKITTVSVVPYNLLRPFIFYSCRVFGVERMNFIIAATGFPGLALSLVWVELSIACRELWIFFAFANSGYQSHVANSSHYYCRCFSQKSSFYLTETLLIH